MREGAGTIETTAGHAGVPAAVGVRAPVHVKSIILLAGGVRRNEWTRATGRPATDLPLPGGESILCHWRDHAWALANRLGQDVGIRVVVSKPLPLPTSVLERNGVTIRSEHDSGQFRGTGGLLRDLTADLPDDAWVLVASASQVLLQPLAELLDLMTRTSGDIVLLREPDGTAGGLQLVRCGTLRTIRHNGFVDFKEQALPALAKVWKVQVAQSQHRASLPIRTLDQYISGLRTLTKGDHGQAALDPYIEEWDPTFSIIEPTATVHASARIHDSVVMDRASVGAGAVVVRSVVCSGASVEPGQAVIDTIVPSKSPLAEDASEHMQQGASK